MPVSDEQYEALQRQLHELQLRGAPPEQRSAIQRQMDLDERERRLNSERDLLNQQARAVHAHEIAARSGMDVNKLLELQTTAEMDQAVMEHLYSTMNDPAQLRAFADWLDKGGIAPKAPEGDGTQTPAAAQTPGAPGAPAAPAPGAEQKPAGAAGQGNGTAQITDDLKKVTERWAGKGSHSMGEWLADKRQADGGTVIAFGGAPEAPVQVPGMQQQQTPAPAQAAS